MPPLAFLRPCCNVTSFLVQKHGHREGTEGHAWVLPEATYRDQASSMPMWQVRQGGVPSTEEAQGFPTQFCTEILGVFSTLCIL